MISIVIPTYNDNCVALVKHLAAQAAAIDGLEWEIVVGDDGSTDSEVVRQNMVIDSMAHCRYVRRLHNVGRARIRNFLAQEARGEWLFYFDGDRRIILDDHLQQFLAAGRRASVCYGGYRAMPGAADNLRRKYEVAEARNHYVAERRKRPYRCFYVSNLFIRRDVMLAHPLDDRFLKYGYEDVLFGKRLEEDGVAIEHIDVPIGLFDYESNACFLSKTEEGLHTLWQFQDELADYSTLLYTANHMSSWAKWGCVRIFRLMKNALRNNLCGTSPSLLVFKLYKLGYFLNLSPGARQR